LKERGSATSTTADARELPRLDRRAFVGIGLRTLGTIASLPTAAALLAGCGGGEETAKPSPSAPAAKDGTAMPDAAPAAPEPKPAAPAASPADAGARTLVTEVEAMRPTVEALQYVKESTRPDQQCSNCLFYTAAEGGLGKCQLFLQGYVDERGWCSSWSARPSA
jgi:hypothetical protein